MDNLGAYDKIVSEIYNKIEQLIKHTNKEKEEYILINNALEFVEQLKKGNFDEKLLNTFYFKLKLTDRIETIKQTNEFLKMLENKNIKSQFEHQACVSKKKIQEFEYEIHKFSSLNRRSRLGYEITYNEKEIDIYNRILNSIDSGNFTKILDGEELDTFVRILENSSLSDFEKCTLMYDLTLSNANKMRIISNQTKQRKKAEKIVEKQNKIKINAETINLTEDVLEKINSIDENSDEYDSLLEKAKIIIDSVQLEELTESENKIVELTLIKLKDDFEINRSINYSIKDNYKVKRKIIYKDISEILIPKFESSSKEEKENIIILIKDAIEKFEKLEQEIIDEKSKIEKENFNNCLEEFKTDEQIQFIETIKNTIMELKEKLFDNYRQLDNETYNELHSIYNDLISAYKDYDCSLNGFADEQLEEEDIEELKEILNYSYDLMKEKYKIIKNLLRNLNSSPKEDLYQKGLECYKGDIHNIIVFADNQDEQKSIIENDILDDENLEKSDYKKVLDEIKKIIYDDFKEANGIANDHKVKYSATEEFKKKYKLKSNKCGQTRIIYGRYSTNLSKVFPDLKYDPHIYMIYKVSYGSFDGTKKANVFSGGVNRCYKNISYIDHVIELMKLDWEKLAKNKEEYEIKKEEINKYLYAQCVKLGHFINTYELEYNNELGDKKHGNK